MGKRFLVVGHEARDHAIAWKLAQSPHVETVYVQTGNRAMPFDGKLTRLPNWSDEDTADFAVMNHVACTIVGDTSDMEAGFVDEFLQRGLPILGAHQAAAMLEGSKTFAKDFMQRYGVPTARHRICDDRDQIDALLEGCSYPLVLKSNLRVGSQNSAKIIHDPAEAVRACHEIFDAQSSKYDDEDDDEDDAEPVQVLLEEFISGKETSYTILMDGDNWTPLIAVRDYKRLYDNDVGVNTGGMGSYAPVPWLTQPLKDRIAQKIVEPTLRGMREEGLSYRGFLYFGIMVDAQGEPWVLEYNTRLGDTEGETILTMWEDDLSQVALQAASGSIANLSLNWRKGWAVSLTLAPQGYPGNSVRTPIDLPFPAERGVKCYGSIVRQSIDGRYTTGPGPVACVTVHAPDIATCRKLAYETAHRIDKDGLLHYRKDIALELEAPTATAPAARSLFGPLAQPSTALEQY